MNPPTAIELIAWHANGSVQSIALEANQALLVGKSSNCGLRLRGHDLSDIHCRIGFDGGQLWVQDWMSATGTKVNGEPVTSKVQVGHGAIVEVGSYKIQLAKSKDVVSNAIHETPSGTKFPTVPVDKKSSPGDVRQHTEPVSPVALHAKQEHKTALSDVNRVSPARPQMSGATTDSHSTNSSCQTIKALNSAVDFPAGDEDVYDRETVELLQAEIEDLRAALAQRDAERCCTDNTPDHFARETEDSSDASQRIRELADEANRADERVMLLEEMLHAAEDANRAEVEERAQLEAWAGDIEQRISQREQEYTAELEVLRERLDQDDQRFSLLQRELKQTASSEDSVNQRYEETVESLQQENRQLQDFLIEAQREIRLLQQKLANVTETTGVELREERAKIAKEHAEMSRLKFEYAQKIKELDEGLPKPNESDPRLQILQEHRQCLREISRQKIREQEQYPVASRLKSLWNRVR